jgi:esterase
MDLFSRDLGGEGLPPSLPPRSVDLRARPGGPPGPRSVDLRARPGGPIILLHGLFGSSRNWVAMGRKLSVEGRVFALDLRNHGDSPHASTHTLQDCVDDLLDWSRARSIPSLRLVGHSMGGLVAMRFALLHPDLVEGVAAVDIAPRPYPPEHQAELGALGTDISVCRTRAELDALLAPLLPRTDVRQFILTNAIRDGEGFRWRIDARVLAAHTVASDWAAVSGRYPGAALMVACGRSPYVRPEDHAVMRRFFPNAAIETIPEADHWPHVSSPDALEGMLRRFLAQCNNPAGIPSEDT